MMEHRFKAADKASLIGNPIVEPAKLDGLVMRLGA
jgi:hypothetical protein